MFKFENILVCLDLTEMDDSLIRYSKFICDTFSSKKVTFIHVVDSYEVPEELADVITDEDKPLKDILFEEIREKVQNGFESDNGIETQTVLEDGLTVEKIVKYAKNHKVDLAIMGKKIGYVGQGGVVKKIIGLIPASVLLVSETSPQRFSKAIVRTGFAKPSVVAYEAAQYIQKHTGLAVEFHHVYKLPYNYFPVQTPQEAKKLRVRLEPHMKKSYSKFVSKYKLSADIPFDFTVDVKGNEAQALYNYAVKKQVDLVISGTRLKSHLANVIMDSTSEKLAGAEKNIPVLIVKDVKEFVGFFQALFD